MRHTGPKPSSTTRTTSPAAKLAMPATFEQATLEGDGVIIDYRQGGQTQRCRTRVLINAGGPWASHVAQGVKPPIEIPAVDLVQGTHIVIAHPLSQGIYYVESPTDGRAVFVMPWKGQTLIGTTETPYRGNPSDVAPLPEEEEYLAQPGAGF